MGKESLGRSAQVSGVIHIYYVSHVGRYHDRIDQCLLIDICMVLSKPLASRSKMKFFDKFVIIGCILKEF